MARTLHDITEELVTALRPMVFAPPVAHVYNPLEYAREPWDAYVEKYGQGPREVILVGMNPGPWGMVQTGVPFGEVAAARDWLQLERPVHKPFGEHPKRPITGFDCPRSEVSGRRVWGWAADEYGTPEAFFERFFVANYCPLAFLEASGRNRTPDKLPAAEREPLFAACDRALRQTAEWMQPRLVVGLGKFAEARAKAALDGMGVQVASILHPSPASPLANRGWAAQASAALKALGVHAP